MSVSTACTTRCRSTPFQRNLQRSAADLDLASLGSQACEDREREKRERERGGGGGGGLKGSAHFALQILVLLLLALYFSCTFLRDCSCLDATLANFSPCDPLIFCFSPTSTLYTLSLLKNEFFRLFMGNYWERNREREMFRLYLVKDKKFARSSCRGFVAQWLERPTGNRKTRVRSPAGLRCVFFVWSSCQFTFVG